MRRTIRFVDDYDVDFYCVSPWYCSPGTPVWEECEQLGVTGRDYKWRHATMDALQADELSREMIRMPQRSVFFTELTANCFWSQLLFYSNGFTSEEVRTLMRCYNAFMGRNTPAAELRASAEFAAMSRVLARHEMPPPPDARFQAARRDTGAALPATT